MTGARAEDLLSLLIRNYADNKKSCNQIQNHTNIHRECLRKERKALSYNIG